MLASHKYFTRTVEVTMLDRPRQLPHCKSHKCLPRPQSCSRDVDGRLREADGWQPKSSPTASGRWKPACWGDLESNHGCPGPLNIKNLWRGPTSLSENLTSRKKVGVVSWLLTARSFPQGEKAIGVNIAIERKSTHPG